LACEDLPLPPVIGSSRSALLRRLEPLAYQERESATDIRSKISGDQIVRTPAAADIDLRSRGAYHITIAIERVQKARLVAAGIWLNSPQCVFLNKE
jgi:hypothetical protein